MAWHNESHVCPWWIGYLLVSPMRRWFQNPEQILSPHISDGMTVLDIGPGMGFFTIPAGRMVGDTGRVIAVDFQQKMLNALAKRAEKAGVANRITINLCRPDSIGVVDAIDFCLAFYMVHEVPDASTLFFQIRTILKPHAGRLLLAEPAGWNFSEKSFQSTLCKAAAAGLELIGQPEVPLSRSALFGLK